MTFFESTVQHTSNVQQHQHHYVSTGSRRRKRNTTTYCDNSKRQQRRLVSTVSELLNQTEISNRQGSNTCTFNNQHMIYQADNVWDKQDLCFASTQYFALRALALLQLQSEQLHNNNNRSDVSFENQNCSLNDNMEVEDDITSSVQLYLLYSQYLDSKRKSFSKEEENDDQGKLAQISQNGSVFESIAEKIDHAFVESELDQLSVKDYNHHNSGLCTLEEDVQKQQSYGSSKIRNHSTRRHRRFVSTVSYLFNQMETSKKQNWENESWINDNVEKQNMYFACAQYFALRALALLQLQQDESNGTRTNCVIDQWKTDSIDIDDDDTSMAVNLYLLYAKYCDSKRNKISKEVDKNELGLLSQLSALDKNDNSIVNQHHLSKERLRSVHTKHEDCVQADDLPNNSKVGTYVDDYIDKYLKRKKHNYKHYLNIAFDTDTTKQKGIPMQQKDTSSSSLTESITTSPTDCATLSSCSTNGTTDDVETDEEEVDHHYSNRSSTLVYTTSEFCSTGKDYQVSNQKNKVLDLTSVNNDRKDVDYVCPLFYFDIDCDDDTMEEDELKYECLLLQESIDNDIDTIDHLLYSFTIASDTIESTSKQSKRLCKLKLE